MRVTVARAPSPAAILRRECACSGSARRCAACEKKSALRRTAERDGAPDRVPEIVHEVLRSDGRALDPALRGFMEARLGHDFSRVRVHTDARAAESVQAVGAAAYTVGSRIVFGHGRFAPHSAEGRRLLAHELAHTVESAEDPVPGAALRVGAADDAAEHAADVLARRAERDVPASSTADTPRAARLPHDTGRTLLRRQPEKKKEEEKPLIPIPVFEELDPMVIVPDMEGIPEVLRGQEIKLSDLQKAMDIVRGKSLPSKPSDFCAKFQMEEPQGGPMQGLCCRKLKPRTAENCCKPARMDVFEARCCTGREINVQGRCITPRVVSKPKLPPPKPTPPPTSTPAPAPTPAVPVPAVIFFQLDRPRAGEAGEDGLRKSATDPGAKSFDDLVQQLQANPRFRVQLTGKASSAGPADYNVKLGERRARLAAAALVEKGIDRARIVDRPDAKSPCAAVEPGIRNCGETGAAARSDPADQQVHADVFEAP